MLNLAHAFHALRRSLARDRHDAGDSELPSLPDEVSVELPPAPLPLAPHDPRADCPEFNDLLTSLGHEYEAPTAESIVARKDSEIAELRGMLAALRPLGDRMAAIDKARLEGQPASEGELAETRVQLADERLRAAERKKRFLAKLRDLGEQHTALRGRYEEMQEKASGLAEYARRAPQVISGLKAALEQQSAAFEAREEELEAFASALRKSEGELKRTRGWHRKARARADKNARTAAERWKQILELRRQLKDAKKQLEAAQAPPTGEGEEDRG